jgi:hypothetical protein
MPLGPTVGKVSFLWVDLGRLALIERHSFVDSI